MRVGIGVDRPPVDDEHWRRRRIAGPTLGLQGVGPRKQRATDVGDALVVQRPAHLLVVMRNLKLPQHRDALDVRLSGTHRAGYTLFDQAGPGVGVSSGGAIRELVFARYGSRETVKGGSAPAGFRPVDGDAGRTASAASRAASAAMRMFWLAPKRSRVG
jgi:hypothetical protein